MNYARLAATVIALSLFWSGCYVVRGLRYLGPDVRDGDRFAARSLPPAPKPDSLARAARALPLAGYALRDSDDSISMADYLAAINTAGLLVVRGDSVVYEYYGEDYGAAQPVLAYSVTKSWIGALVGIAVEEGRLQVSDPVRKYLPELDEADWQAVTVEHVLQMTTGNTFREDEHIFHENARFYLGKGLRRKTLRQTTAEPPGRSFRYRSGDTQLLTQILEAAVQPQTVTEYLHEKLWIPLGIRTEGRFNVDRPGPEGIEKGFCCLNATAAAHAKLGMVYRDGGRWRNEQVLPRTWVEHTRRIDTTAGSAPHYQYHWWLGDAESGVFLAEGIINQFIYVDPRYDLVIVKQSDGYGVWNKWTFMESITQRVLRAMGEAPAPEEAIEQRPGR